ncbi:MAG: ATP-binding cassette domain-containing protein [Treponema sp.]|nr:ATP-binding cassette domain-containing protein [Treponema sp.]HAK68866.1 ABC transporter [Treponema sp.]HBB43489.1 ABC transporter [Treponema sp.]
MIEIENLSKTFETADGPVHSLKNVSLKIEDGEIFGVIGMSGAGKSTLVRSINMLEKPTSGRVLINGQDVSVLDEKELRRMRRKVTMIFQSFNLLSQRNCLGNVCFPLELSGSPKQEAVKKAQELLELVGLGDKANAYPSQLSGGQQQRVAIARALATNPDVLLCDEATSALDPKTTASILDLIQEINRRLKITVIVITHQMSVVEKICSRVAILEEGTVVETGSVEQIFSRPRSRAAKNLVFPEGGNTVAVTPAQKNSIRVVFNGAVAANRPLVADLAIEKGIRANIAYASTKSVGDRAFGSLFLSFDDEAQKKTAVEFFSKITDITVEEL